MNTVLIPFIIAMLLGVVMGGSGTGPAFSAAYGANIIKLKWIPVLFGLMVFLGAIIAGKETAATIGKGLLSPDYMNAVTISIILFSVFIAILVADVVGIPQSTSQATVFAVVAAAVYFDEFNSTKLFYEIIPTWFITPVISFVLCFLAGKYIYKPLRKTGITMSKKVNENYVMKGIILLMSLYVAFSIGANNVANAAGPIATMTMNKLSINQNSGFIMLISILIIAPGFGIGSSLFGKKILNNTGKEIFLFGRFEAIIIAFVSGSLLLATSVIKGIPTSLVQLNVAAIIGIGVAKLGFKNIFKKTEVNRFFIMWAISPMISFLLTILLLFTADKLGYISF